MTVDEAVKAFVGGKRVDLKCYHGTFLNREIKALRYQKDVRGKVYVTADLTSESDKKSVLTAAVEWLELSERKGKKQ